MNSRTNRQYILDSIVSLSMVTILLWVASCNNNSNTPVDAGTGDSSTDSDTDTDTDSDTDTGEPTCWWEPMETGTEAFLGYIWGLSPGKIYTGGLDHSRKEGIILEYNGNEWVEKWSLADRGIGPSWGTSDDDLFFTMSEVEWVGDEANVTGGSVRHWDGSTSKAQNLPMS